MRLFRYTTTSSLRTASGWLRASLAALMLVFTLNLAAHAAHSHHSATIAQTAAHTAACGYCTTFGGLADPLANPCSFAALLPAVVQFQQPASGITSWHIETAARPRAPPVS